jgi:UDP-N-acetylglucosamine--N-acetylmuramyl-(pentapeptide) pyrophosphoryl-undecaprenol N-acetylglucosamine transferase
MNKKRILLTGGGTAGHVTPNLALLPRLRALGYDVSAIGTAQGMERGLLSAERVAYHAIPAGKLRRYLDIRNVTDIVRIKIGFLKSLFIIAKIKPSVCFSKGGFVSCPVVWASWFLRVPVVIHESDLSPGLANRLSLPFASAVCYSFPETAPRLPARTSFLTGIPVRETLMRGDAEKGRALCGFTDRKPVIVVTGGSQGAQAVNAAVRGALDRLLPEFNVCHICGKGNLAPLVPAAGGPARPSGGYAQFEYVNQELADLFALADAVVSRAGATTLFELLALRKPALLIPLPLGASRGDQILNAASFEKHGWSRVLPQEKMTPETLIENIRRVFQNRQTMISSITSSAPANGTEKVIEVIERIVCNRTHV